MSRQRRMPIRPEGFHAQNEATDEDTLRDLVALFSIGPARWSPVGHRALLCAAPAARRTHALLARNPITTISARHRPRRGAAQRRQASSWRRSSRRLPIPISPTCGPCASIPRQSVRRGRYPTPKSCASIPRAKPPRLSNPTEMTAQTIVLDKNDNLYVGTSPDGKVYKVTPRRPEIRLLRSQDEIHLGSGAWAPTARCMSPPAIPAKFLRLRPTVRARVLRQRRNPHPRVGPGRQRQPARRHRAERTGSADSACCARRHAQERRGGKTTRCKRLAAPTCCTRRRRRKSPRWLPMVRQSLCRRDRRKGTRLSDGPQTRNSEPLQPRQAAQNAHHHHRRGPQAPSAGPRRSFPFPALTSSSVYRIAPMAHRKRSGLRATICGLRHGSRGGRQAVAGHRQSRRRDRTRQPTDVFSRLAKTESATGDRSAARAANGKFYVATANPGKVFALGPDLESEGSFESQTFDAHIFSRWGRLTWWGDNAAGRALQAWSSTFAPETPRTRGKLEPVVWPLSRRQGRGGECPAARFVQWKVVLHGGKKPAPEISWVNLAYLPKNVAPEIDGIAMQNPGMRIPRPARNQAASPPPVQLRMPAAISFSSTSQRSGIISRTESSRFDANAARLGKRVISPCFGTPKTPTTTI